MSNETLLSTVLTTFLLVIFISIGRLYISASRISRFNHFAFIKVTQNIGRPNLDLRFEIGEDAEASYHKRSGHHVAQTKNKKIEMILHENEK